MRTRTDSRWRLALLVGGLGAALAVSSPARASDGGTVSAGTPSIAPEPLVPRFYPGSDAGAPGHLNNFTPAAINYADCVEALDLEFTLDVSNAPIGDEIQVWAGSGSADCTQTSARSSTAASPPDDFPGRCWPAASTSAFDPTKASTSARVNVLDLVAHIGDSAAFTSYVPTTSTSVCKPFGTNGPVQLNIYFILVPPSSSASGSGDGGATSSVSPPDGVSGLYRTAAALVGPFAPLDVTVPNSGITATSLSVFWEPQDEPSIQGYNVYVQDQGTTGGNDGVSNDAGGATTTTGAQCHPALACDAGSPGPVDAGGDDAVADDAGVDDAGADDAGDAGVHHVDGGDAGKPDATVDAGGSSSSAGCDAGLSDAWAPADAAAFAGLSDAAVAAMGCELTSSVNVVQPSLDAAGGNVCVSGVLASTFVVDGGVGTTAVVSSGDGSVGFGFGTVLDAGIDADAADFDAGTTTTITPTTTTGSNAESAGISTISNAYFNAYQSGQTTASYTIDGLTTGHHYAVTVAAVDSYGNVGPIGALGCSIPTNVDDFYTVYSMDGGSAGGGFCALAVPGAGASGSLFGAGLAVFAGAFVRRRARRRVQREASS